MWIPHVAKAVVAAVTIVSALPGALAAALTPRALPSPNVVIPLYIYPSTGAWNTYITAIKAHPKIKFTVIIDPNNGPGTGSTPDSNYITAIAQMNALSNVRTLGYVHTSYTNRAIASVKSDIAIYAKWATYTKQDIHMDGIFFDEAPSGYTSGTGSYMSTAASTARSGLKNNKVSAPYVMFNPGTTVDTRFFAYADNIVVYESTWSAYSAATLNNIATTYRAKSTFMVYSYAGTAATAQSLVKALASAGYSGAFLTTTSGYVSISPTWANFVNNVGTVYGTG